MELSSLIQEVGSLTSEELEALYLYVQQQRKQRGMIELEPEERIARLDRALAAFSDQMTDDELYALTEAMNETDDRHNHELDIDDLKQIFAELREGFTAQDLDELAWAMNVEVVKPLDEDS